jgi:hypothetical protein
METTISENNKKIWSKGEKILLKIGGILSAITAISATCIYLYGYTDKIKEAKVKKALQEYFRLDSLSQCSEMALLFTPVVEDYYDQSNLTRNDIVRVCELYRLKWPYFHNVPNYNALTITVTSDKGIFVSFPIQCRVKRRERDKWLRFDETIHVEFSKDYKIKSIAEHKNK